MTLSQHNPTTITAPLGAYSNGVSVQGAGRWLHIAGQVGVDQKGALAGAFVEQAEAAWSNLVGVLNDAGMTTSDLVKVNHYLVSTDHLKEYGLVRSRHLGEARPASTLLIVQALARPEWLVEVDAVAWKA